MNAQYVLPWQRGFSRFVGPECFGSADELSMAWNARSVNHVSVSGQKAHNWRLCPSGTHARRGASGWTPACYLCLRQERDDLSRDAPSHLPALIEKQLLVCSMVKQTSG